jgi:predicted metal-dependent enzyme (double-stranded beta helix superfamily)
VTSSLEDNAVRSTGYISQYTPDRTVPEVGTAEVHPALDTPLASAALHPDRLLWNARQLRDLTDLVGEQWANSLRDIVEIDEEQRWWARLGLTAGVELWLLTWAPGQGTEPHDHGGASCSFSVFFGELHEDYRYPPGPVRHARYSAGASIGFGRGRAHQVHNFGDVPSASIHAYSPPLLPVHHYADLADVPPVTDRGPRRPADPQASPEDPR